MINRAKKTAKKTTKKTTKKINYLNLPDVEHSVEIEDGEMWLKSGKYESPSVSVNLSDNDTLSDWMRKITLRNVVLTVEENDRGYPELVISGQEDDGDDDDAGDE